MHAVTFCRFNLCENVHSVLDHLALKLYSILIIIWLYDLPVPFAKVNFF